MRVVAVPVKFRDSAPVRASTDDATILSVACAEPVWKIPWHWVPAADGKPPEIRLDPKDQFRFYAGQPDSADPSHFTIDYDLDGKRGTIDGRLKDDGTVSLEPREGMRTGQLWYPRGAVKEKDEDAR